MIPDIVATMASTTFCVLPLSGLVPHEAIGSPLDVVDTDTSLSDVRFGSTALYCASCSGVASVLPMCRVRRLFSDCLEK